MKKSEATKLVILQKAFEIIYVKGYQATSIDNILAELEVTKGAFFYHFQNKDQMGLAIINELMFPAMYDIFVVPLKRSLDPAMDIYALIKSLLFDIPDLKAEFGCPAGNLTQEMSLLKPEFGYALLKLVNTWKEALTESLQKGKLSGSIRKDVKVEQVVYFVMSGYWGVRTLGKLYNSTECYKSYLNELKFYLRSLE